MGKKCAASLAALVAVIALVASCGGGQQQNSAAAGDAAAVLSSITGSGLAPVDSGEPAAYVARNPTWLYDVTGDEFAAYKKDLIFGEKLFLLGETAKKATKKGGAVLDWVKVKRELGGEVGWAIDAHLIKGRLGVVTAETAVYSLPDNAALTKSKVPAMKLVSITDDPTAGAFSKVGWYDQDAGVWTKDKYVKTSAISTARDDYKTAQQLTIALALGEKDKATKLELLKTAQSDYPGSAFAPLVAAEIAKLEDVTPATAAPAGGQYQASAAQSASVYDKVPADPQSASVVYTLGQGESVTVLEESASQVSFDGKTGVWLKVSYDDSGASKQGWVFSADFAQ